MDDKKQRIRELEKEYLKLSRKEVRLIRKQQNYLIDTSQERKKLNAVMKKIEDELSELKKNLINYPVEIKILKEPLPKIYKNIKICLFPSSLNPILP